MSGTRVNIDLFFKDKTPAQVNAEFPQLLSTIRTAKAKATKINEGKFNEEMTIKASYHICHHDENFNIPCEPEQDI